MHKATVLSKLGATAYIVWGVLHLNAAYAVYILGASLDPSMVQARVYQDAWNLLFCSLASIGLAVYFNWSNSLWGYWVNALLVSVTDIGFIIYVLVPGHMDLWPGILGPVFWVLGLLLTTLALRQEGTRTQSPLASA